MGMTSFRRFAHEEKHRTQMVRGVRGGSGADAPNWRLAAGYPVSRPTSLSDLNYDTWASHALICAASYEWSPPSAGRASDLTRGSYCNLAS